MKKALKARIRGLKKPQFKRLKELTSHAKNLYNQTLWTLREAYNATGFYFSYSQMDKAMKQVKNLEGEINYQLLKAKVAQQTLKRVAQNFKSFFKAHQDFQVHPHKYKGKPKPPQFKQQTQDNLVYNYQAIQIKDGFVVLEKGLEIKLPKQLLGQTIKQVEIIPKTHSFYAVFVYEESQSHYQSVPPNDQIMAIDLGMNNLATCVTNGIVQPFIIDGRRLKSINAYYNKRKAKMQATLKTQRGCKWSAKLQRLTDWRSAAVSDYLHRASSQVVKTCVTHRIAKVVVGDIIQSLNRINLGKRTNQNFVNLSEEKFIEKLRYKLGLHGIELVVTDESYTSKASFVDGDKLPKKYNPSLQNPLTYSGKRIKRGLYKTSDGTLVNADVNGAYNILRKTEKTFSFASLAKQVGAQVKTWLHPIQRYRFLKHQTHQPSRFKRRKKLSNPKLPLGEGIQG